MFENNSVKTSIAMSVNSQNRYNLRKLDDAIVNPRTDRNGVCYFSVEFHAVTSKGNIVLFRERRLDKDAADKKAYALNKHSAHIKAEISYAMDCVFEDNTEKRILFGHALTADLIR